MAEFAALGKAARQRKPGRSAERRRSRWAKARQSLQGRPAQPGDSRGCAPADGHQAGRLEAPARLFPPADQPAQRKAGMAAPDTLSGSAKPGRPWLSVQVRTRPLRGIEDKDRAKDFVAGRSRERHSRARRNPCGISRPFGAACPLSRHAAAGSGPRPGCRMRSAAARRCPRARREPEAWPGS